MSRRFFFSFVALLTLNFRPVAALTVEQLLDRISYHEQQSTAVRFNYKQTTKFENGPVTMGEGTVTIQKPNRVRLLQSKPEERLTVSDGKSTWIYTPSKKQAWKSKKNGLSVVFQGTVLPLEDVANTLKKTYDLSIVSESTGADKVIVVTAIPKDKNQEGNLELSFGEDDWIPRETVFHSATARVSTSVSHVDSNPEVSPKDFQWKPPAGTDVIDF